MLILDNKINISNWEKKVDSKLSKQSENLKNLSKKEENIKNKQSNQKISETFQGEVEQILDKIKKF